MDQSKTKLKLKQLPGAVKLISPETNKLRNEIRIARERKMDRI